MDDNGGFLVSFGGLFAALIVILRIAEAFLGSSLKRAERRPTRSRPRPQPDTPEHEATSRRAPARPRLEEWLRELERELERRLPGFPGTGTPEPPGDKTTAKPTPDVAPASSRVPERAPGESMPLPASVTAAPSATADLAPAPHVNPAGDRPQRMPSPQAPPGVSSSELPAAHPPAVRPQTRPSVVSSRLALRLGVTMMVALAPPRSRRPWRPFSGRRDGI